MDDDQLPEMTYPAHLIDELARCYAHAAVDALVIELMNENGPGSQLTNPQPEKDERGKDNTSADCGTQVQIVRPASR